MANEPISDQFLATSITTRRRSHGHNCATARSSSGCFSSSTLTTRRVLATRPPNRFLSHELVASTHERQVSQHVKCCPHLHTSSVPDEALLLELVNAKTSEAQARAELDEIRKTLQVQKRRADDALLQAQAEAASAKLEAETAKAEAEQAKAEAHAAKAEVFDASPLATPFTSYNGNGFVSTPIQEEEGSVASSE